MLHRGNISSAWTQRWTALSFHSFVSLKRRQVDDTKLAGVKIQAQGEERSKSIYCVLHLVPHVPSEFLGRQRYKHYRTSHSFNWVVVGRDQTEVCTRLLWATDKSRRPDKPNERGPSQSERKKKAWHRAVRFRDLPCQHPHLFPARVVVLSAQALPPLYLYPYRLALDHHERHLHEIRPLLGVPRCPHNTNLPNWVAVSLVRRPSCRHLLFRPRWMSR